MRLSAIAASYLLACGSSCAAPPPERPAPAPSPLAPATPAPPAAGATPEPPNEEETTPASAAEETTASDDDACPEDMVLIEGEYCEELRVKCLEKWHAPQNHLYVCEKVERPTKCVGETTPVRYCIDRYEFPNRKGVRPMVMQNFYQAQLHCANRGKRICTEKEWTKACEGPDNKPFPYGYERDPTICHGDQPWGRPVAAKLRNRDPKELERLWQGVKSGSQPKCVSDYGVYDMPANADELASSVTYGKGPKSDFDNVTTGGPWYKGVRNMCRPKIYSHDESFAYYYLSWRCCQEADGKPTDPRTPKQVKRGMKWEEVVRLAHNSWKLPFNPLVPGDVGHSPAGPPHSAAPKDRSGSKPDP